ncbi:glycosyltransferase [Geminocystis sp. CENA526]|uniref:glycosyltransferase family 4 protein n=1 Tax=Geminocystis sp. CENA526 TaxID=1355871 RepID=UPI003D6FE03F
MTINRNQRYLCCQIGAREHYAIPRALEKMNQLDCLITDSWISNRSIINKLPENFLRNLRERFHPDLSQAQIFSFTESLIAFELQQQWRKRKEWNKIIARNNWFQTKTVNLLKKQSFVSPKRTQVCVFAYSYAALDIFRYAKSQGWKTILGQIDPAIEEENLVQKLHQQYSFHNSMWQPAPPQYWKDWKLECELADEIIVNSEWSSSALQKVGIPSQKIEIIPLVYESEKPNKLFTRSYPDCFNQQRPLKVLFLGQVILRKGIIPLLESATLLKDQPIEFIIVGSLGIRKPSLEEYPNVKWIGSVPRSITAHYYQEADVFIFPTLSDGFGLTQLEAQSWQLPIIASQYCGEVVNHGVNGLVLSEVSGETIAQALKFCIDNPQELQNFANNAQNYFENFSLMNLQKELSKITLE